MALVTTDFPRRKTVKSTIESRTLQQARRGNGGVYPLQPTHYRPVIDKHHRSYMLNDPKPDSLLTVEETATYLRVKPQTLATWRCTQRYPLPYVRVGRAIRYRLTDVQEFLRARTIGHHEDET